MNRQYSTTRRGRAAIVLLAAACFSSLSSCNAVHSGDPASAADLEQSGAEETPEEVAEDAEFRIVWFR